MLPGGETLRRFIRNRKILRKILHNQTEVDNFMVGKDSTYKKGYISFGNRCDFEKTGCIIVSVFVALLVLLFLYLNEII